MVKTLSDYVKSEGFDYVMDSLTIEGLDMSYLKHLTNYLEECFDIPYLIGKPYEEFKERYPEVNELYCYMLDLQLDMIKKGEEF